MPTMRSSPLSCPAFGERTFSYSNTLTPLTVSFPDNGDINPTLPQSAISLARHMETIVITRAFLSNGQFGRLR